MNQQKWCLHSKSYFVRQTLLCLSLTFSLRLQTLADRVSHITLLLSSLLPQSIGILETHHPGYRMLHHIATGSSVKIKRLTTHNRRGLVGRAVLTTVHICQWLLGGCWLPGWRWWWCWSLVWFVLEATVPVCWTDTRPGLQRVINIISTTMNGHLTFLNVQLQTCLTSV